MSENKQVRLTSNEMCHTPGIVAWAMRIDGGTFNKEATAEYLRAAFLCESYQGLAWDDAIAIAQGNYTVDGDTVIVGERDPK